MPLRPCLDCGAPTTNGTRCPPCASARNRQRDKHRGNRHKRGYTSAWARIATQVTTTIGQCIDCGHQGSKDNPLTADHIIPKAAGGTDHPSNLTARCRRCNSAKGGRVQS